MRYALGRRVLSLLQSSQTCGNRHGSGILLASSILLCVMAIVYILPLVAFAWNADNAGGSIMGPIFAQAKLTDDRETGLHEEPALDEDSLAQSRALEKWLQYGIIRGDNNGEIRPDSDITRAELAVLIVRLIGYSAQSTEQSHDVRENDWFYSDIMKLKTANIMQGFDGYMRPYDPVTREEAVTIIARAFKIPMHWDSVKTFTDWNDISNWARHPVLNMWVAGYLKSFGEVFYPQENITRIETITIIDTMFAAFYAQPGVYSGEIDGNVLIRSPDVKLMDARISGDVFIVEGVGEGYYTIYDSAEIEGEIRVYAGKANPYPDIDPSVPMCALTFDDGPSATTVRILDTLEAYGVRATFFVVGYKIEANAETISRAASLGCELGGHTWSHTGLTLMSRESLIADAERVSNAIFEVAGVRTLLIRPPGGSYSSTTTNILGTIGISTIHWSIDPRDWSHLNANTTYSRILDNVRDGAIVLMHDTVISTATAVEMLVPTLLERGYQLVTVSELLAYSDIGLQPGMIYFSKYNYR